MIAVYYVAGSLAYLLVGSLAINAMEIILDDSPTEWGSMSDESKIGRTLAVIFWPALLAVGAVAGTIYGVARLPDATLRLSRYLTTRRPQPALPPARVHKEAP